MSGSGGSREALGVDVAVAAGIRVGLNQVLDELVVFLRSRQQVEAPVVARALCAELLSAAIHLSRAAQSNDDDALSYELVREAFDAEVARQAALPPAKRVVGLGPDGKPCQCGKCASARERVC